MTEVKAEEKDLQTDYEQTMKNAAEKRTAEIPKHEMQKQVA